MLGPVSESQFIRIEGVVIVTLVVSYVVFLTIRLLSRSRPDFRIGAPLAVGLVLRLLAIAAVGSLGLNSTLRGGDELTFLDRARVLASTPLGHGYLPHGLTQLQTVVFALQLKLGFLTQGAMRITQ